MGITVSLFKESWGSVAIPPSASEAQAKGGFGADIGGILASAVSPSLRE